MWFCANIYDKISHQLHQVLQKQKTYVWRITMQVCLHSTCKGVWGYSFSFFHGSTVVTLESKLLTVHYTDSKEMLSAAEPA